MVSNSCIYFLVESCDQVGSPAWHLHSSLLKAVRAGDAAQLCALLDRGLDCDTRLLLGGWARPAVCLAVESGHVDLVAELCRHFTQTSVAATQNTRRCFI